MGREATVCNYFKTHQTSRTSNLWDWQRLTHLTARQRHTNPNTDEDSQQHISLDDLHKPVFSPQTVINLLKEQATQQLIPLHPPAPAYLPQIDPETFMDTYIPPSRILADSEDDCSTDSELAGGHFITGTSMQDPLLATGDNLSTVTNTPPPQVDDILIHPDHQEFSGSDTEPQPNHCPLRNYMEDKQDPDDVF